MHKGVLLLRHFVVPFTLTFCLLLAFAPEVFAASHQPASFVGPKKYYLALGDSVAFGYQPNLNWNHGYADDFFANLKSHGTTSEADMACPGESSSTFINGGCPYALLRKYFYIGSQLNAAVSYLHAHAGQVSPVTLDIGANDVLGDVNASTCTVNSSFNSDLAQLDTNLTTIILPQLKAALTVNGRVSGDLVLMNYYDPYQNVCPNSVSVVQTINEHLTSDVNGFGAIVDVFTAFGGPTTPNPNICTYTWMCSIFTDIHPTSSGYSVIANTFENGVGY